jgi:hypothetical protein
LPKKKWLGLSVFQDNPSRPQDFFRYGVVFGVFVVFVVFFFFFFCSVAWLDNKNLKKSRVLPGKKKVAWQQKFEKKAKFCQAKKQTEGRLRQAIFFCFVAWQQKSKKKAEFCKAKLIEKKSSFDCVIENAKN